MVKFSENDPNYSVVVQKLDCMLEQSKSRVSGTGLARTFTSGWKTGMPTNGVHHASGKSTTITREEPSHHTQILRKLGLT